MKRLYLGLLLFIVLLLLSGCGGEKADYTTSEFETAVNNGEDVSGKTVLVEVNQVVSNIAFGYVIEAGDSLHFTNSVNPDLEEGDTLLVEVSEYVNFFGEYTVPYEIVE